MPIRKKNVRLRTALLAACVVPICCTAFAGSGRWTQAAKKATTDYVKKRTADEIQDRIQSQMKNALEALKKKAEANPQLARSGYVKALEDVVNNRGKIREIAEGLASGDATKVQAAKESMAKEFATRVLDHADKDSLPGKVLGGMLENVDKIKDASGALGSAAGGNPRPALEMAGKALINMTPIGGAVEFYSKAYGVMKYAHDKFVNNEMEDMYKIYKRVLEENGPVEADKWIRNVMGNRVGRVVMDARKIEVRQKNIDELSWAKDKASDEVWKRLTDVNEDKLFDDVVGTFRSRAAKEKLDADNAKRKAEAEKEADIALYILGKTYEKRYGEGWETFRGLDANQMKLFLQKIHELMRDQGFLPGEAAELLALKLVYGQTSEEYLAKAAKYWKHRKGVAEKLVQGMALLMTSHDAKLDRAKIEAKKGVASRPGALMSASGSWERRGVDDGCSPSKAVGPYGVAAGGKMVAHIKYSPPIGIHYSLSNKSTRMAVYYSPKLRHGFGAYGRVGLVYGQGDDKDASRKIEWPGPGRFKVVFSPAYGCGPLLGRQFKQAWSAKATITEMASSDDAVAGSEVKDGDTITVGPRGRAVLMLPNGGRLKLGPNTIARFVKKGPRNMEVVVTRHGRRKGYVRYARPKDLLGVQFDVTFRVGKRRYRYKGTEAVIVLEGDTSSVAVIEGEVEVEEDGKTTIVTPGKQLDAAGELKDYDLSKDDRGEVDGVPLAKLLLDDSQDEPFADVVAKFDNDAVTDGWTWEDPKSDCTLRTPKPGTLVATVPSGNAFYRREVTAPRLLHKITGDFDLTAHLAFECKGGNWSRVQFIIRSPASYLGSEARQFEKHTEGAHYRHMGVCWRRRSNVSRLEGFRVSWRKMADAPDGGVQVRLTRRGDVWRTSWSRDGKTWTLANREFVPAPNTLWTGWSIERESYRDGKRNEPAVCTLSQVMLRSAERGTMPTTEWDAPPWQGKVGADGDTVRLSLGPSDKGKARAMRQRRLTGDFDVRASFTTTPWTLSRGQAKSIRMFVANDNGRNEVYIGQYQLSYAKQRSYRTDVVVNRSDRIGLREEHTDDTAGAFRITRQGGQFATYYLDSGQWVLASTRFPKGFDDDVFVCFEVDNTYGGKVPVAMDATFELLSIDDDVAPEPTMPLSVEELQTIVWQVQGDDSPPRKGVRLAEGGALEMHPKKEWIHEVKSWGVARGHLVLHHKKGHIKDRATAYVRKKGRWTIRVQSVTRSRDTLVLTEVCRVGDNTPRPIEPGGAPMLRQWAAKAKASSEYSAKTYSTSQVLGVPNCFRLGHQPYAWSPKKKDGTTEWLELDYEHPVVPRWITVREACGSGFVTKIEAARASGEWVALWQGKDDTTKVTMLFTPELSNNGFLTRRVRVTMHTNDPGWIEVDAVELVGVPDPSALLKKVEKPDEPEEPVDRAAVWRVPQYPKVTLAPELKRAVGWCGKVVDIRTGKPIPGCKVWAGYRGRVDSAPGQFKSDGSFVAIYKNIKPGTPAKEPYYLRVYPPKGSAYWPCVQASKAGGATLVKLVPKTAYLKGRVVDADTGKPLPKVQVGLTVPGAIRGGAHTDENGEFEFKVDAHLGATRYAVEGVPDAHLPTGQKREAYRDDWRLAFNYESFHREYKTHGRVWCHKKVDGKTVVHPPIALVSSATPDLYTWFDVRLPKGNKERDATDETVRVRPARVVGAK